MNCPDCKIPMEDMHCWVTPVWKCPKCGIEIEEGDE